MLLGFKSYVLKTLTRIPNEVDGRNMIKDSILLFRCHFLHFINFPSKSQVWTCVVQLAELLYCVRTHTESCLAVAKKRRCWWHEEMSSESKISALNMASNGRLVGKAMLAEAALRRRWWLKIPYFKCICIKCFISLKILNLMANFWLHHSHSSQLIAESFNSLCYKAVWLGKSTKPCLQGAP